MSITPDCLTNLVGLSKTPCDCWADKPADYNTSISGRYLDELLTINNWKGLENCEETDIWEFMATAREYGIRTVKTDVLNGIFVENEQAYPYFRGRIGEGKAKVVQAFSDAFAGMMYRCNPMKGGYIRFNAFGGIFDGTGTVHLYVMNNLGELKGEYDINTTANVYVNTPLAIPLELPLYSEQTEFLHYYVFFANGPIKPLNNSIMCNTCKNFSPCWDLLLGCYDRLQKNNRYDWARFVQVSGFTFDDTDDLYDIDKGYSSALYGLTADVETWCRVDDMFCVDDILFAANPHYDALAMAILHKSGLMCIDNNLLTDKLNRANLINRETLLAFQPIWQAEYDKYVAMFVNNVDLRNTSCIKCRDRWGMDIKLARS